MSVLDTGGFSRDYYIRVQRNMIEAGIRHKAQYADLYIDEITTDPTMETLCQCCSDFENEEGKKQRIKWLFHVKSRKDPNFHMIIGSTCITQYEGIDPDELQYCLLLFEQEKKRIERQKRKDAQKARVEEYKEKYADYIAYLKKYYEYRRFYPKELHEIYKILTEGTKIFREKHEEVLREHMAKLPLAEIEAKLVERRRAEEDKNRLLDEQRERLERVLERDPDNLYVKTLRSQVNWGIPLSARQLDALEEIENRASSTPSLLERMERYLAEVDNPFVRKVYDLEKRHAATPAQRHSVAFIVEQFERFKETFSEQAKQLVELEKLPLPGDKREELEHLKREFARATRFGKFYSNLHENKFKRRLQRLYDESKAGRPAV